MIACLLFLFFLLPQQLTYSNSQPCFSSSCGKITNITHPFRLKQDPPHCGNPKYELDCISNITVLSLYDGYYLVESINYNNYTIRLVDPNIQPTTCSSLPRFFLSPNNFTDFDLKNNSYQYHFHRYDYKSTHNSDPDYDEYVLSRPVIYMKCTSPPSKVVDKYYADDTSCWDQHTYVIVGDPSFGILEPQCRVTLVTLTSFWGASISYRTNYKYNVIANVSYMDIHKGLRYGFEISWMQAFCHCFTCYLNDTISEIQCYNYSAGYWSEMFYHLIDYVSGIYEGLREFTGVNKLSDTISLNYEKDEISINYRYMAGKVTGRYVVPFIMARIIFGLRELIGMNKFDSLPNNYQFKLGVVTGRYVLPFITVRVIIGILLFSVLLIYKYRRRHSSIYENIEDFLQGNTLMPIRYSFKEIKQMTKGFKVKLGEGGYGDVYRGKLISGPFVAIKMLKIKANANGQDFISEVATIGRIYHSNVVRLIGFCVEGLKRALVYEYMPNGSLDKYIFNKEDVISLTYNQIHEISLGIARGISYLHQGCDMQILHFDIKPHNILLDENFVPKVSDFGLAKLYPIDNSIVSLTAARGTIGYMAPELFYQNIGRISYKADVYSFGMLLIEMAGKRRNLNSHAEHSSQLYFPFWIYEQLIKNREKEMEDTIMEELNDVSKKMFMVALWCIQLKPIDRPSMSKVVEMLEGDITNIEMPPKPVLYPHETIQENLDTETMETETDIGSTSYVEEIETNSLLKYST